MPTSSRTRCWARALSMYGQALSEVLGAHGDVGAGRARLGRDESEAHQPSEHLAPDAVGEDRLEDCGHDDDNEKGLGDGVVPERQEHYRADGDDGADRLGESFGW